MKNRPNRRRVFRLQLPRDGMLDATINEVAYKVIELSEFGIIITRKDVENDEGKIRGEIHWSNETASEFSGELGRIATLGRVIWNVRGIEMSDVVREQRHLLARVHRAVNIKRTA